jgi:LysR family transcriptional regulator, regulator of abg operon
MKLNQLQHMVAIVEHGSLRAAARRLNLPQPALTRSIRALEKELGETLFLRETTGMALTATGQRFHARSSIILNEARRALDEIAQHSGEDTGKVVVALSIMPHVGMLPYALQVFRQRYPKVQVQLIEGLFPDVESALREGSIDFYLGAAPRVGPAHGLAMELLFENRRTVVCRKGHPLAGVRSLKALASAEWAVTGVDYNAEDDIGRLFDSYGMQAPRVSLRARSAMSMMVALAHSDLLAMLPVQWEEFPMTRDTLQTIRIREVLSAPNIVLIRRPDFPLTPASEYFCDVLCRATPLAG